MLTRVRKNKDENIKEYVSIPNEYITKADLTPIEFKLICLMLTIKRKESFSQNLASERLKVSLNSVSKAVKSLIEKGYIELKNYGDRYVYVVKH